MLKEIFLFTSRYPPLVCGVGDHTHHLWQYVRKLVSTTGILTLSIESAGQPGVEVVTRSQKGWRVWAHNHPGTAVLWQYSPYAMHPRGIPWWVVMAMWQLRRAGIRQAIFFHEVQIRYTQPGLYNKCRALQQQLIANICSRLVNGRVATSIPLYQSYFFGKKPWLIPISPNLLPQPGVATVPYRVVGFANRLFPWLLQALAAVQQLLPAMEVVWIGKKSPGTPEETEWFTSFGLRCSFTGVLPAEDLAAQLQTAALVLLPLELDQYGRGGISLKSGTLSAALGMGKPVIASPGDMTQTHLLLHGQVLHLAEGNTAAQWQQAIMQLLQQPGYAHHLAEGAQAFYQNHLLWQKTAPAIFRMLKQ